MSVTPRVCLITGANSGIGKATALGLANRGMRVIMVCRNESRGAKARAQIVSSSGNNAVDLLIADLSSQRAIHRLVQTIYARYERLHVLINNAGGMYNRRKLTVDGIERTFAVNHLAYFLLAHTLLDRLKASAPARIVNIASSAAHTGAINFADLMGEQHYSRRRAYAQSKRATVLFTYAMARYIASSGVTVNCLSPGTVATNLGGPVRRGWLSIKRALSPGTLELKSVAEAADDVIRLAAAPEVASISGVWFAGQQPQALPAEDYHEADLWRLWRVSGELTQLDVGKP